MRVCGRIADLGILGSGVVLRTRLPCLKEVRWTGIGMGKDASSRMYLARLNMDVSERRISGVAQKTSGLISASKRRHSISTGI